MLKIFGISLIFLIVIIAEIEIKLPFLLICLGIFAIINRSEWDFFLAIFLGIIIDSLSFRLIGESSIFFVIYIGLIFLYQRRFEIQTVQFVFFISAVGVFVYLLFFGSQNILLQSIVSGVLAGI